MVVAACTTDRQPQKPFGIGAQMYQYIVFNEPNWDYKTLNFDSHVAPVDKVENRTINALDPNLRRFAASGGKLLMYHGWADPQISAGSGVEYYERMLDTMGSASKVRENVRLFMVPGMNHCGGGNGTATFDMLAALEQWVEKGSAPRRFPQRVSRMARPSVRDRSVHTRRLPRTRDRAAPTKRQTSSAIAAALVAEEAGCNCID